MISKKEELENVKVSYYFISLSFSVIKDVLNDLNPEAAAARRIMYDELDECYNSLDNYRLFSKYLAIHQNDDNYNYVIEYSVFLRVNDLLPMENYVATRDIKDKIKKIFTDFFESINVDYEQINIKSLT